MVTEDLPDAMEDAVNEVGVAWIASEVTLPELVDTVVDTVVEAAEGAVDVVADAARDAGVTCPNSATRFLNSSCLRRMAFARAPSWPTRWAAAAS